MVNHRRRKNRHANKLARRLVTKVREADNEFPFPECVAPAAAPSQQLSPSGSHEEDTSNINDRLETPSPSSLSENDPPTTLASPTDIRSAQQPKPSPEQQQAAVALQFAWGNKDLASPSPLTTETKSPSPNPFFFGAACTDTDSSNNPLPILHNNDEDAEATTVNTENDPVRDADDDDMIDNQTQQSALLLHHLCWWRDLTLEERERIDQASPSAEQKSVAKFVRDSKEQTRQQKEVEIAALQQKYRSSIMNLDTSKNDTVKNPASSIQTTTIRNTVLTPTTRTNIQVPHPHRQAGVDMNSIYKSAFQARWIELRAQRCRRVQAAREIQLWWAHTGKRGIMETQGDDEEENNDDDMIAVTSNTDESDSDLSEIQSEGSDSSDDEEENKSISWGCLLLLVMVIVTGIIAVAIVLTADAGVVKALIVEVSKSSSNIEEGNASTRGSDDCEAQEVCETAFR